MTDTSNAQLCAWSAVNMPGRDLCGCAPETSAETGRVLCVACQPMDDEIAADLAPWTHTECKARNLIHSSGDCNWDEFDDSGSDEECVRKLVDAGARVVGELLATFEEQT